jgi:S-adenosylmethionine:tRNA ribosyltransferase-isomerase
MRAYARLFGLRFRGEESARVEAALLERMDACRWRARIKPAGRVHAGDRLRFGESSESMACLLAFLDAEVHSIEGDDAVLGFAFSGPALDEAIERLASGTEHGRGR